MEAKELTPWLWVSPIALNSNSSTLPVLLAILVPVSPAPAAGWINMLAQMQCWTRNCKRKHIFFEKITTRSLVL